MSENAFKKFKRKVLAIALIFAESKKSTIKYTISNEEKKEFKLDISPLEECVLFHFITGSDDRPIYTLRFIKKDDQNFEVIIDNKEIEISLPIFGDLNNLQIVPVFNDTTNNSLNSIKGDFEEKLKSYLEIMWDGGRFLTHGYLGIPIKRDPKE